MVRAEKFVRAAFVRICCPNERTGLSQKVFGHGCTNNVVAIGRRAFTRARPPALRCCYARDARDAHAMEITFE